jgi:hypothetical protein
MKKLSLFTGGLMILAALTFWISWLLMPDPGTTDTPHILAIVKESRGAVLSSVLVQIVSSCLYIGALFCLAQISYPQKPSTLTGVILFGIGVLGLCSDAFFHLLAYFMTDNAVTIQEDVIKVMDFMQTTGVVILVPILLPFFIGGFVTAIGLRKQNKIGNWPVWILTSAFAIGIVGAIITKNVVALDAKVFSMTVLGLFAAGHISIGIQLATNPQIQFGRMPETAETA